MADGLTVFRTFLGAVNNPDASSPFVTHKFNF